MQEHLSKCSGYLNDPRNYDTAILQRIRNLSKKEKEDEKKPPKHQTSLDSSFLSPERLAELNQLAAMAIYHGGLPMGLFEQPHIKELKPSTLHSRIEWLDDLNLANLS